ncbi:hypothetical protein ACOI9R_10025 [Mesorhizobium japonicum]
MKALLFDEWLRFGTRFNPATFPPPYGEATGVPPAVEQAIGKWATSIY